MLEIGILGLCLSKRSSHSPEKLGDRTHPDHLQDGPKQLNLQNSELLHERLENSDKSGT